jgi:L-iditol 2-dehydrogenase
MTMKALVLTQYQSMQVADIDMPDVGPDDVLVRVEACGICGSDIHGYDGSTGRRIPPLVMGHEAAGVIESVGANVSDLIKGDRVTFDSMVSCGKCHFCRTGHQNLCDNRMVLGVSCGDYRRHGAFAEFISVPRRIVYQLPDELSFEHAALVEAVSVAVHAVAVTPIQLGDTAVIVGAGMIGLLTLQAAKAAGATRIIAVDLNDRRLKVAQDLGATDVIRGDGDVPAQIKAMTGGRGSDVALEVVGATSTIKTAIESVRKGGCVTLVGNISPTIELPLQSVVTREIRLQGTCGCNGEYPQCIDLMARGIINVAPLITSKITLAEGPAWFERLYAGDPDQMKVLVQPQRR